MVGTELQDYSYSVRDSTTHKFNEVSPAVYAEAEYNPIYWLAFRGGVRAEHSTLLNETEVAPRLSMAVKTGRYSTVSLASGMFYQNPDKQYLLYGYRPNMQLAVHYIANYQILQDDRTFRIEGYYKDYRSLVRDFNYANNYFDPNTYRYIYGKVDNSGYGYATGIDLFWRDKKTVKDLDYWISYSYIDTRRLYKNYLAEATPDFISNHNLSVVTRYFVNKWQTQFNVTYAYSSGRPYYDPSQGVAFYSERTPDIHNLSLTVNYLTHIKKWFTVVYAGVDNLTDQHNVFGYRYGPDGTKYPQLPALYRSVFVGANFSLSEFKKDEL